MAKKKLKKGKTDEFPFKNQDNKEFTEPGKNLAEKSITNVTEKIKVNEIKSKQKISLAKNFSSSMATSSIKGILPKSSINTGTVDVMTTDK